MSKLNYLLPGLVGLAIGINTANGIFYLSRPKATNSIERVEQLPVSLEDCVVDARITDLNIPILKMERIRMRASGLDPIKVELAVNNGPNQGNYVVNIESFTNPADGTPKSKALKKSYQDLFDTFSSDLTRGDSFPIPCDLFDSLRSHPNHLITKLPY